MAVHDRVLRPDSERTTVATTKCTKGGCKLDGGRRMPGAGLSRRSPRKAPLGQSAFQPYWGKLAVRNDTGDRGNVGIIRSPIRASILPDHSGHRGGQIVRSLCCGVGAIRAACWRHQTLNEINDLRKSLNVVTGRQFSCNVNWQSADSLDSRYFGPLPASAIIGRAVPVWTDEE